MIGRGFRKRPNSGRPSEMRRRLPRFARFPTFAFALALLPPLAACAGSSVPTAPAAPSPPTSLPFVEDDYARALRGAGVAQAPLHRCVGPLVSYVPLDEGLHLPGREGPRAGGRTRVGGDRHGETGERSVGGVASDALVADALRGRSRERTNAARMAQLGDAGRARAAARRGRGVETSRRGAGEGRRARARWERRSRSRESRRCDCSLARGARRRSGGVAGASRDARVAPRSALHQEERRGRRGLRGRGRSRAPESAARRGARGDDRP